MSEKEYLNSVFDSMENVQIEPSKSGVDNLEQSIYRVSGEKEVKFLGLFKIKIHLSAQVDEKTGQIISIKKPWWSFLVW